MSNLWTQTGPRTYWRTGSISTSLYRPPTILSAARDNGPTEESTAGAAVFDTWLLAWPNRHLDTFRRIPQTAEIAFVSGMLLGYTQGTMVLIDFSSAAAYPPASDPTVWPNDQGAIYATTGGEMRLPFGPIPIRLATLSNGERAFGFRWRRTGNYNRVGYHLWLEGYVVEE